MAHFKSLYLLSVLVPMYAFSLSLEEGAKALLSSNPNFKQSVETFRAVNKEYDIADNGYRPTLDLVGAYGHESTKSSATGYRNISGMSDETSLILNQNIFNGFLTENTIEQQKGRLDAAGFSVAEKADRLMLQYTSAYINLLKQKEFLELAQENAKTYEALFKQIKERSDGGFGRISETHQAGSRLTLSKANLVSQENNYKDALSTFEKLYGIKVDAKELSLPLFMAKLPDSFEKIKENSLTCNPTLKVQESNIRFAEASYEASKAAFYPKLDFELAGTLGHDVGTIDGKQESVSALLRLRYNLYNKGADVLDKEKYAIMILKEKEILAAAKRDLTESVQFSWESYESTKERIAFLSEHQNYSKETLDAYQQEFAIGRRDLINLLDAEGEYYSARQALIDAKMIYLYAKYRLLDNMGVLSDYFEPDFAQYYKVKTCSSKDFILQNLTMKEDKAPIAKKEALNNENKQGWASSIYVKPTPNIQ